MKRTRTFLYVTAVLIAATGVAAASASATATIVRETITQHVSETGLTDDCRPGITGDLQGTEVIQYQSVETANGFHVHGTDGGPGRIDWSDGSYSVIDSVDRFSLNTVGNGTENFSLTHVDTGTTYAADGTFLFRIAFHEVQHVTVANGVLRVDLERGHFNVHGDC
jgi:hypothetical protein